MCQLIESSYQPFEISIVVSVLLARLRHQVPQGNTVCDQYGIQTQSWVLSTKVPIAETSTKGHTRISEQPSEICIMLQIRKLRDYLS